MSHQGARFRLVGPQRRQQYLYRARDRPPILTTSWLSNSRNREGSRFATDKKATMFGFGSCVWRKHNNQQNEQRQRDNKVVSIELSTLSVRLWLLERIEKLLRPR